MSHRPGRRVGQSPIRRELIDFPLENFVAMWWQIALLQGNRPRAESRTDLRFVRARKVLNLRLRGKQRQDGHEQSKKNRNLLNYRPECERGILFGDDML
jgi:hypothetical protein